MLKEKEGAVSGIARAADFGVIVCSFATTAVVCPGVAPIQQVGWVRKIFPPNQEASHQYAILILLSLISWIAVTQWRGSYRSHRSEHIWEFLLGHLATEIIWAMSVGFVVFLFNLGLVSREFLLTFLPLTMVLLTARQLGARAFLRYVRSKGHNIRRVVIMGESERAREFARFIEKEGGPGYQIMPLPPELNGRLNAKLNINFDEAFLTLGDAQNDLEETVVRLVKLGKRVHIVPGVFNGSLFRQSLNEFAGTPVLSIGGHGLDATEAAAKRLLDIVGSLILIGLFSPVLVLAAMLVKLSSRGPFVFSQERLGMNGRRFWMLKFRTMHRDAEERLRSDSTLHSIYLKNHHKVPAAEDPRIAPFGRFLRATSLDELPQLFNVLKGDMSLVGPRPVTPPQLEEYGDNGPLFLTVKPGITGYWQTGGRSEITDFSYRAKLDLEYIRDQSLKTDVHTLLRTIPAVLRRRGAA
jgi:exopolysaccharide biosynthesis polyprenyl glycosylphosphotransferase